ncbi:MAG: hypothetical protein ACLFSB_01215 [Chitinispirillaceae bacterium]
MKVSNVQGTVKVQHTRRKVWEPVSIGDQVEDNDVLETFFQTKVSITFGTGNVIMLGSNSKAQFRYGTRDKDGLNITLLSGGLFVKAVDGSSVNIYTGKGVAHTDSGTVSTVVESRTGYTGYQILGGDASIRNISQSDTRILTAGQTTIIRQDKAPTAPLYITFKHVSVLKHFFGDEYIENEMKTSNIEPTESQSTSKRSKTTDSYEIQQDKHSHGGMYKKLFSHEKIYAAIMKDRWQKARTYTPVHPPAPSEREGFSASLYSDFLFGGSQIYPRFVLSPEFGNHSLHASLRIPFSRSLNGMDLHVSGFEGVLDKIGHVTISNFLDSSFYLHLGPLKRFSMNNGLVVHDFSNANPYSAIQSLGLSLGYQKGRIEASGFLADLSHPIIGGVSIAFLSSMTRLHAGYYFDGDQYNQLLSNKSIRYSEIPQSQGRAVIPHPDSVSASAHIYELGLHTHVIDMLEIQLGLSFDFAQKIIDGHTDGFVTRGPSLFFEKLWMRAGLGLTIESGRLVSPQFHRFYLSNRLRIQQTEDGIALTTQNNMLSKDRSSSGFHLFCEASPFQGIAAEFSYKQDFSTRKAFADTSVESKNNYCFDLIISINDQFFEPIHYASIYVRQDHGGYYPPAATPFASWGWQTGFEIQSAPLFKALRLHLAGDLYYLDIDPQQPQDRFNNNIDAGDFVFDLLIGGQWSF